MERARQLQDGLARLWSEVLAKNSALDDALSSARRLVVGYTAQEQYGALSGLLPYIYDQVLQQSPGTARVFGQIVQEACLQVTEPPARHLLIGMSGFKYSKLLVDTADYEAALDVLRPTLEAIRQLPVQDRTSIEASTLLHLGIALTRIGRLDEGLEYYSQSLDVVHAAELHNQLPGLYFNLGNNARLRGGMDEASECYRQAIDAARAHAPNDAVVPLAMLEMAKLLDDAKDAVEIRHYLEEAEQRSEALGLQNVCHDCHALLGLLDETMRHPDAAATHYERALAAGTQSEEKMLHCLRRLVHIHVEAGRRDDACYVLDSLLHSARGRNDPRQMLLALRGLADVLFASPATEQLIAVCKDGVRLAEQLQDRSALAMFLGHLGDAYERLGQGDESRRAFGEAWKTAAEADPDSWMPDRAQRIKQQRMGPWRMTIAKIDGTEAEREQAGRDFLNMQPIGYARGIGALYRGGSVDPYRGARYFFCQGLPLAMTNDDFAYKMGQEFLRDALNLYLRGNHLWEAQAVARAMACSHEINDAPEDALASYDESVRLLEEYRGHLADHDNRVSYLARCAEAFHDAVRLSLRNGDTAAAFQFAERGKARSLVELLLESQGRKAEPRAPFTVEDAQRAFLDDDTALLEYLVGRREGYLFVLTRAGLQVHALPPAETIADHWRKLRAAILDGRDEWTRPARQLYRHLIGPAEQVIRGKMLIIVTDGVLDFLPFELLLTEEPIGSTAGSPDRHGWGASARSARDLGVTAPEGRKVSEGPSALPLLLHRHAVVYVPSAATLAAVRRRTATAHAATWSKDFIGFAPVDFHSADRLPRTEDEVRGIARLFPADRTTVHVGPGTTKASVCGTGLSQYRFVHFATHGQADQDRPELCGLVFPDSSQDNLLDTAEVFHLDLPADLVTASACVTGLGRQVQGEGIMGLKRGFLHAGTRSVCVSLWNVADDATTELMTKFYRHLLAGSWDKAEALRRAKRELIEEGNWAAPFFWAPFVLSGDWR